MVCSILWIFFLVLLWNSVIIFIIGVMVWCIVWVLVGVMWCLFLWVKMKLIVFMFSLLVRWMLLVWVML